MLPSVEPRAPEVPFYRHKVHSKVQLLRRHLLCWVGALGTNLNPATPQEQVRTTQPALQRELIEIAMSKVAFQPKTALSGTVLLGTAEYSRDYSWCKSRRTTKHKRYLNEAYKPKELHSMCVSDCVAFRGLVDRDGLMWFRTAAFVSTTAS